LRRLNRPFLVIPKSHFFRLLPLSALLFLYSPLSFSLSLSLSLSLSFALDVSIDLSAVDRLFCDAHSGHPLLMSPAPFFFSFFSFPSPGPNSTSQACFSTLCHANSYLPFPAAPSGPSSGSACRHLRAVGYIGHEQCLKKEQDGEERAADSNKGETKMGICREWRARERMSHIPFVVKYYIHSVSEGHVGVV